MTQNLCPLRGRSRHTRKIQEVIAEIVKWIASLNQERTIRKRMPRNHVS